MTEEREYKAQAYSEFGASSGGRKKTVADRASFNGVVELSATEYARVEACMGNPGSPSRANRRGSGAAAEDLRVGPLRTVLLGDHHPAVKTLFAPKANG